MGQVDSPYFDFLFVSISYICPDYGSVDDVRAFILRTLKVIATVKCNSEIWNLGI